MDNNGLIVITSWMGTLALLVIGAIFQLDFIGMFIFVTIIFALSASLFMVFEGDDIQDMVEVGQEVSQLRYEVKTLHMKMDEIKRLGMNAFPCENFSPIFFIPTINAFSTSAQTGES